MKYQIQRTNSKNWMSESLMYMMSLLNLCVALCELGFEEVGW